MNFLTLIVLSSVCSVSAQTVSIRQRDLEDVVRKLREIDTKGTDPSKFQFNFAPRGTNHNGRFVLSVDPAFLRKPTVASFKDLVIRLMRQGDPRNFKAPSGASLTHAKKREMLQREASEMSKAIASCFTSLLKTEVMEQTRLFLAKNGFEQANSEKRFEDWMKAVWLSPVKIGKNGEASIPFTHVFLLEKHHVDVVSGLHHWLTYGLLELNNRTKFEGYIGEKSDAVAVISYTLGSSTKPRGSFLLATTPEFDLALYTLCLVGRPAEGCHFTTKNCEVPLVVHRLNPRSEVSQVTTAFPKEAVCEA